MTLEQARNQKASYPNQNKYDAYLFIVPVDKNERDHFLSLLDFRAKKGETTEIIFTGTNHLDQLLEDNYSKNNFDFLYIRAMNYGIDIYNLDEKVTFETAGILSFEEATEKIKNLPYEIITPYGSAQIHMVPADKEGFDNFIEDIRPRFMMANEIWAKQDSIDERVKIAYLAQYNERDIYVEFIR